MKRHLKFFFKLAIPFFFFFEGQNLQAQEDQNIQKFNDNSKCLEADVFFEFPKLLQESSALVYHNGYFWTINDGGNAPILYALHHPFSDSTLFIKKKDIIAFQIDLPFTNEDWEALAFDSLYCYIGDFGNNLGARKNLRIFRINIEQILNQKIVNVDTLKFEFENQTKFKPRRLHAFDCESMVVMKNEILLFTKNWNNLRTNLYKLDKHKFHQKAQLIETWNPNFYVTDACLFENQVYLSGYNFLGNQFIYKSNWKKGTTKKLNIKPAQIEGIAVFRNKKTGELEIYMSTEKRKSQPAGIYKINIKP